MRILLTASACVSTCAFLITAISACNDETTVNDTTSTSGSGGAAGAAQGGAGGGIGGQGGTAGGYDSTVCELCAAPRIEGPPPENEPGACSPSFNACHDDPSCEVWLECIDGCFDSDWTVPCVDACNTTHQSAATLYGAFLTCICNACAAEVHCTPACP